jgi:capsular polysaccharide biosynthesis protein
MLLQPPVAGMDSRGRKIFIDSPETIKTLIEAGAFNTKILDHLQNSNSTVPRSLRFRVSIPRLSDSLMISYEDANVDLAKKILEQLAKQMLEKYNEVLEKYINNYESELLLRKNEISAMDSENKLSVKHIEQVRNRINELVLEMKKLDAKIKLLIDEQNKYLSDADKRKNLNGAVLYNSLTQQLTTMKMMYKNEIVDYLMQIERQNDKLKSLQYRIDIHLLKIRQIKNEMNSIQNIQLIKPPVSSRRSITPKTKLYIMAASVVGLVIMLSLAFFLEFLFKHKNRKYQ